MASSMESVSKRHRRTDDPAQSLQALPWSGHLQKSDQNEVLLLAVEAESSR